MHRFSFRPASRKPMGMSKASSKHSSGGSALRLFSRRPSRTPSLDELASPNPFPPSVMSDSGSKNEKEAENESSVEEDSDDERVRLRRARARAQQLRSTSFASAVSIKSTSPPRELRQGDRVVDDQVAEDSSDEQDDEDDEDDEDGDRLSSDVTTLQRQVRALLRARIQAEEAWRQETDRLHEQLRQVEARTSAKISVTEAKEPLTLTPRERELLRLLVRIVGKEQIRVLLAGTTPTGLNTSAELRRRLVARAKESRVRTSTVHAVPSLSPKTSEATGPTPAPLLCGARKHEMSAAMK